MTHDTIHFWRDLPIFLAAPPQTAFIVVYWRMWHRGRSWDDFVGRALFLKSFALMLLIDFAAAAIVFQVLHGNPWEFGLGNYTTLSYADTALYWLVSGSIWYQLHALLRQRRYAQDRKLVTATVAAQDKEK